MSRTNAKKLIRNQQHQIAVNALAEWSKKHKTNKLPDMVLHVLNLMVDQAKLKDVPQTVKWIEGVVARHDGMEKAVKTFADRMQKEDDKERAKAKRSKAAKKKRK